MAVEKRLIPFDEFAGDVAGFFERVIREHETLLIKRTKGELVMLKAAQPKRPIKARRSSNSLVRRDIFLSTAGGWKDLVDADKLIRYIYESRNISSRPV